MVGLEDAWEICAELYAERVPDSPTAYAGRSFGDELVFCLLGGHGVSFELALSATERLRSINLFGPTWSEYDLEQCIFEELSMAQFLPLRADGSRRKYRYPRKKAEALVRAREWARSNGPLKDALVSIEHPKTRRRFLCSCPGVGLKTASWFLRNVGLGDGLAIIDVHIARALEGHGRTPCLQLPRDYGFAEDAFLKWCEDLGASVAAFDLFVWEWQRGSFVTTDV